MLLTPRSKVRYNGNVVAAAIAAGDSADGAELSATHAVASPPQAAKSCNCRRRNGLSPEQVVSIRSVAQRMESIDVAACLANVDDLLMATPVRNGRSREVRLSLSPTGEAKTRRTSSTTKRKLGFDSEEVEEEDPLLVPVEIMLVILSHLPAESLGCLRRVCRR